MTSRRLFLKGAGILAAGGTLAAYTPTNSSAQAQPSQPTGSSAATEAFRTTKVVPLGTAGGPAVLGDERKGVSTAVIYDGQAYVIDLGHGAHMNFHDGGLGGDDQYGGSLLSNVRGIFFTHLHSDHLVEWPAVYATGPMNIFGRPTEDKIRVFGPGDRQSLVRVFPPGREEPEPYNPDSPTAGIQGRTEHPLLALTSTTGPATATSSDRTRSSTSTRSTSRASGTSPRKEFHRA